MRTDIIAQADLSVAINHMVTMLPAATGGLILWRVLCPYLSQSVFQKVIFSMMAFSPIYTGCSIL